MITDIIAKKPHHWAAIAVVGTMVVTSYGQLRYKNASFRLTEENITKPLYTFM